MTLNKMLMTSASAALILFAPAYAQETPEETAARESAIDRVLGTVTVTATKKANVEDVQTVAVAMTAYNADTLDALNVTTLESLS